MFARVHYADSDCAACGNSYRSVQSPPPPSVPFATPSQPVAQPQLAPRTLAQPPPQQPRFRVENFEQRFTPQHQPQPHPQPRQNVPIPRFDQPQNYPPAFESRRYEQQPQVQPHVQQIRPPSVPQPPQPIQQPQLRYELPDPPRPQSEPRRRVQEQQRYDQRRQNPYQRRRVVREDTSFSRERARMRFNERMARIRRAEMSRAREEEEYNRRRNWTFPWMVRRTCNREQCVNERKRLAELADLVMAEQV
ncbi:CUN098 hypothetical protein [Culex nigripalpus nucleopolyhedrovirus]|uniref:Uncharacterized protein n=1 Tax=Culex nigripalpus nucleopolyhedrovirus (isolate Florida/1997) TaxID=645993 RepID=Q919H9_NPVCO|nr:CUN098 hypothetical protein [Culex nigripalpus nucleopolyhedrovirus]AAK94176.1 CUN098 hypothetical protein [Culex nigripalpus nucleopolyhedrovirus]